MRWRYRQKPGARLPHRWPISVRRWQHKMLPNSVTSASPRIAAGIISTGASVPSASDRREMVAALNRFPANRGDGASTKPGPITFLFSGQGAQYLHMGEALYQTEPNFRRALDRCFALFEVEGIALRDTPVRQRRGPPDPHALRAAGIVFCTNRVDRAVEGVGDHAQTQSSATASASSRRRWPLKYVRSKMRPGWLRHAPG